LADAYDNFSSSAGITVAMSVTQVVGATGTISGDVNASSGVPPVSMPSMVTDSSGTVGISSSVFYYVSSHAGDVASVQFNTTVAGLPIAGATGKITPTGGVTSQLVLISPPAISTAGVTFTNLSPFTLERRDDFNNATNLLNVTVNYDISAGNQ